MKNSEFTTLHIKISRNGSKNYLFSGVHDVAEDTTVICSLLGCCKSLDIDFSDRMVYLLSHIYDYDTGISKDFAELLPHK